MDTPRQIRFAALAGAALVMGACASNPDAFARHQRTVAEKQVVESVSDEVVCPVVVWNATDHQLQAEYALEGETSRLGVIPAGRSLTFQVRCTAQRIEASATAQGTGFFGGPDEYHTEAVLDRTQTTRVRFTLTDRVR